MATATKTLYTAEEFVNLELGEGIFELVKGEIVEEPMPMPGHGRICVNVDFVLEAFGRQSWFGYALSNDTFIVTERRSRHGPRRGRVLS